MTSPQEDIFSPVAMSSPHSVSFEETYISKTSSLRSGVSYLRISFDPEVDEIDTNESTDLELQDNTVHDLEKIVEEKSSQLTSVEEAEAEVSTITCESEPDETLLTYVTEVSIYDIYEDITKSYDIDILEIDLTAAAALSCANEDTSDICPLQDNSSRESCDEHIFNIPCFDLNSPTCDNDCCDTGIDLLFQENVNSSDLSTEYRTVSSETKIYEEISSNEENFSEQSVTYETHDIAEQVDLDCDKEIEKCSNKSKKSTTVTSALVAKHIRNSLLHRTSVPTLRTCVHMASHCAKRTQKEKHSSTYGSNIRTQTPHMKSYIALRQQCRMNDSQLVRLTASPKRSRDYKAINRLANKCKQNSLIASKVDILEENLDCASSDCVSKVDVQQKSSGCSSDYHTAEFEMNSKAVPGRMKDKFTSRTSKFKSKQLKRSNILKHKDVPVVSFFLDTARNQYCAINYWDLFVDYFTWRYSAFLDRKV